MGRDREDVDCLRRRQCRNLVIIGGVTRPDLANIKFDLGAIRNLPYLLSLSMGGGDDTCCRASSAFSKARDTGARRRRCGARTLGGRGNARQQIAVHRGQGDIDMAFKVVRALGRLDVGQAAVVVKGHVLAVEAAEGTDAMLVRCVELRELGWTRRRNRAGVLVKAPKPGQEERVDLPTIGPETVRKAAAAGLAGIAVAAGQVLIAERAATIEAATSTGCFCWASLSPAGLTTPRLRATPHGRGGDARPRVAPPPSS